MKSRALKGSLSVVFLIITHCAIADITPKKVDSSTVIAAIHQINTDYENAFIKGDSSLFLNTYTSDACLMPANSPAICGAAGQLAFFKFAYKSGIRDIKFTTFGIFGITDQYVTEQGSYEMFGPGETPAGKGKYLVLWKKTRTGWKMFRDMFNADTPPLHSAK